MKRENYFTADVYPMSVSISHFSCKYDSIGLVKIAPTALSFSITGAQAQIDFFYVLIAIVELRICFNTETVTVRRMKPIGHLFHVHIAFVLIHPL